MELVRVEFGKMEDVSDSGAPGEVFEPWYGQAYVDYGQGEVAYGKTFYAVTQPLLYLCVAHFLLSQGIEVANTPPLEGVAP